MKWFVLDIWHPGDYFREREMIETQEPLVRSNQITFANLAWDNGYEIFIRQSRNSSEVINIRNLTDKELRPEHNIVKLIVSNHFSSKLDYQF